MEIFLNGQPTDVEGLTPEVTLLGLLEAMNEQVATNGLTIVEIQVDGVSLEPTQVGELESRKVLACGRIEFFAGTAAEILRMAVADSAEVLPYFEELSQGIAADLRIGKVKEAMERHLEMVDNLEWLSTILKNLEIGFRQHMTESSVETERKDLLDRIVRHLGELRTAQENQDWVGLADILEYEFPDVFQKTGALLQKVKTPS